MTTRGLRVRDARAAAARWVAQEAATAPNFAGAFLTGSAAWADPGAVLPPTSDVDVAVVVTDPVAPPKLGKIPWDGVLVEVTYVSWDRLVSAHDVLASCHLAGAFRTDTVIADPTGRLARLQAAVAAGFAERRWVRLRCEDAESRITGGLAALDAHAPFHDQVTAWLFPAGITTHVLLAAGLRNPTVRLRYPAVRELLASYGRMDVYEELLGLLGCAHLPRERVEAHLATMARAFDAAAAAARTPFPFSSDITPAARPVAVDGGLDLVARGLHREAVFWIAATYARCLKILAADAPGETGHRAGFADLAADLGIGSPDDLPRRAREVSAYLPRLRAVAEEIIAANPEVRDASAPGG
ncbi:hypothetical protein [Microbispora sp. H10836]|uniref:hypothetical protein n=1 Tax=Microbispora sp. H10836 TaxID=2729106 RepID=UPI001B8C28DC|nr:hypothetical protein [Microbispora sp. H10836]